MMFAERFAKRAEEALTDEERQELERIAAGSHERRWTHGPEYLFDLGKEATGGTTPYEMKDARDTWYSKHRIKTEDNGKRHTGGIVLSSHAYGDNLKGYNEWTKPEFARQPIIRDSFFRSTGAPGRARARGAGARGRRAGAPRLIPWPCACRCAAGSVSAMLAWPSRRRACGGASSRTRWARGLGAQAERRTRRRARARAAG